MSDTTTPINAATVQKPNGVVLELKNFRAKGYESFRFYSPSFTTVDGAKAHFSRNGDNGEQVILDLLNSAMDFRARGKANSKLADDDSENTKRADRGDTLLLTEDEAYNFQPGTREINSEASLVKAAKENRKLAEEFTAKGDLVKASYHKGLAKQYAQQLFAKMNDLTE